MKKVRSKVIDATIILENPNELFRLVYASNSIEAAILDFQEIYPDRNITRKSVLSWKFMTVEEFKKLPKDRNDERSVATEVDQSGEAGKQNSSF
jgi:hypothetical protein